MNDSAQLARRNHRRGGSWALLAAAVCMVARADDVAGPATSPKPPASAHVDVVVVPTDASPDAARFTAASQWEIAGYNLEEIIYTISITSKDTRILRCRTNMQGHYLENGKSIAITDQQSSTVFPDQTVRVGNWTGLDQNSGATFTVKCRAI